MDQFLLNDVVEVLVLETQAERLVQMLIKFHEFPEF